MLHTNSDRVNKATAECVQTIIMKAIYVSVNNKRLDFVIVLFT